MVSSLSARRIRWPAFWHWQSGTRIILRAPAPLPPLTWLVLRGASYRPAGEAPGTAASFLKQLQHVQTSTRADPIDGFLDAGPAGARFRIVGGRSFQGQAQRPGVAGIIWPAAPSTPASAEVRLQALIEGIESLPEAFVLYDADDRLMISNAAYAELYETVADILSPGVSYETILLTSVARGQFRTGDNAADWTRRRMEFHRRRQGLFEQHLADGRWIQVSERATPSGGTTSIRADITLLKKREDELNALNQKLAAATAAKSRFLSAASHELRTPMNGILGIVQSLLLEDMTPDQRTRLEIVLGSARMLTALLDDMLDISRIEVGRLEIKPHPVVLRHFIDETASVVAPQANLNGIVISPRVAPELPECVVVDLLRLRQIVLNFLSNAIRYSPPGDVRLTAAMATDKNGGQAMLRIEVSDRGPGVSPQDTERLFRPFERADRSWQEVPEGIGLGLSICRDLAAAMGGTVGVDSEPEQGSCFWIELPLVAGETAAAAPSPAMALPIVATNAAPLRVLVIDDDSVNRLVAQLLLEKLGHGVTTCSDGFEGLARLADGGVDLVLLDIAMPRIGGIEVLDKIRAACGDALPVVAMTANLMAEQTAEYRRRGFQHILPKPLTLEALADVLRQSSAQAGWGAASRLVADLGPDQTKLILRQAATAVAFLRDRISGTAPDAAVDRPTRLAIHSMKSTADMLGLTLLATELRAAETQDGPLAAADRATLVTALDGALATLEDQIVSLS